jgi:hypothetical protein
MNQTLSILKKNKSKGTKIGGRTNSLVLSIRF